MSKRPHLIEKENFRQGHEFDTDIHSLSLPPGNAPLSLITCTAKPSMQSKHMKIYINKQIIIISRLKQ
jgi:hypothetical protein